MPNVLRLGERPNRHDRTMHNTRPDREPYKASVRHWITRGDNQEHTERGIDAQDHLEILGATFCMPRPTRGPKDREWPQAENEDDPYYQQRNAKILDAVGFSHVCPPLNMFHFTNRLPCAWRTRLPSAWEKTGRVDVITRI